MSTLNKAKEIILNTNPEEVHYKKWNVGFRDDYFKRIYWSYFPITQKYFFEGNPAFLYEFRNYEDIQRYPLVMLRDGYIGLLDFFLMNPSPPKYFKTILLISKKFEALIPKQWAKQVAIYEVFSTKNQDSKGEKLLVHGQGVEDLFWLNNVDTKIKELKEVSRKYKKIDFLIPQRESMLSSQEEKIKQYNLLLYKLIYENFGFDVEIEVDVSQKIEKLNSGTFDFINLDNINGFVSDNYIDHHLYSLGGLKEGEDVVNRVFENQYNLSMSHAIELSEFKPEKSMFPEFFLKYKLSGAPNISIYNIYQGKLYKDLYRKHFLK